MINDPFIINTEKKKKKNIFKENFRKKKTATIW